MIAAWMLYAAAVALLLALAAAGVDRALRAGARATRWVWAAAMLASFVLPAAASLAAARSASTPDVAAVAPASLPGGAPGVSLDALLARATLAVDPASAWQALDRPLLLLWAALSLAVALWTLVACRRLWRARREWRPAVVEAAPVLIAGRTGPAVAGVLRTAVVLPEWALAADRALLRLMLAHEQEHVRARDPRLLAAAGAALVLMPWNPALWYQLRRLRLAVEIDCDRRVLRRFPDVPRYGALLLEVGRRAAGTRSFGPRLPLAALGASPSSLEKRIRTMTMRRPRHPVAHAVGFAAVAGALALAACEVPHPTSVAPANEIPLASIRGADAALAPDEGVSAGRVLAAVRMTMPPEMRDRRSGDLVHLWFVADADDQILTAEVRKPPTGRIQMSGATIEGSAEGTVLVRGVGPVRTAAGPDRLAGLDPDAIASVEIVHFAPGRVIADSAAVVWVRLKPGAALADARETTPPRPAATVLLRTPQGSHPVAEAAAVAAARDGSLPSRARRADGGPSAPTLPTGVNAPLYIIDGMLIAADGAAHAKLLDPDAIASIEVLKGAAAQRLYGDRARNGIINITTRP